MPQTGAVEWSYNKNPAERRDIFMFGSAVASRHDMRMEGRRNIDKSIKMV